MWYRKKKQVTLVELNTMLKKLEPDELIRNWKDDAYDEMIKTRHTQCNLLICKTSEASGKTYYNAMICIMDYCVTTPERG